MGRLLIEDSVVGDILIDGDHSHRFRNTLQRGDEYEPSLHRDLERILEPGMVFFDVGARFGYFSMLAESIGCEVFSFEVEGRFSDYLRRNTSADIIVGNVGDEILLDDFRNFSPSVVLIDVEGDEVDVLNSSKKMILENSPRFYIEMHPWELDDSDYSEISDTLSGYSIQWTDHREDGQWNPGLGRDSDSPTYMIKGTQ